MKSFTVRVTPQGTVEWRSFHLPYPMWYPIADSLEELRADWPEDQYLIEVVPYNVHEAVWDGEALERWP